MQKTVHYVVTNRPLVRLDDTPGAWHQVCDTLEAAEATQAAWEMAGMVCHIEVWQRFEDAGRTWEVRH